MRLFRRFSGALALILVFAMALSISAFAVNASEFTDVSGHWAEEYLLRGISEGLLTGFDDGTLRPDSQTDLVQALVLLRRLLMPARSVPAEEAGADPGAWYADSVSSVLSMIPNVDVQYLTHGELTRGRLFLLMADAFRLIPAEPDYSVLDGFTDSGLLCGRERDAAAALISLGYVSGNGNSLRPMGTVTRAELFTLTFSLVENTVSGGRVPGSLSGGALLQHSGELTGRTFTDTLWLGGSAEDCDLSGLTADTVVFLSQVSGLRTNAATNVNTLVIAGGTGSALSGGTYGTVRVASGAPESVFVSCDAGRLEITADNTAVTVDSHIPHIVISGQNCTLAFSEEGGADTVTLTNASGANVLILPSGVEKLSVDGSGNTVTISGSVGSASLDGDKNLIDGSGTVESLTLLTRNSACSAAVKASVEDYPDGLGDLVLSVEPPKFLTAGENLTASAALSNPEELRVELTWYMGGVKLMSESLDIGPIPVTTTLDLPPELDPAMSPAQLLRLTVTRRDADIPQDSKAEVITRQYLIFLEDLDSLLPAPDEPAETPPETANQE